MSGGLNCTKILTCCNRDCIYSIHNAFVMGYGPVRIRECKCKSRKYPVNYIGASKFFLFESSFTCCDSLCGIIRKYFQNNLTTSLLLYFQVPTVRTSNLWYWHPLNPYNQHIVLPQASLFHQSHFQLFLFSDPVPLHFLKSN